MPIGREQNADNYCLESAGNGCANSRRNRLQQDSKSHNTSNLQTIQSLERCPFTLQHLASNRFAHSAVPRPPHGQFDRSRNQGNGNGAEDPQEQINGDVDLWTYDRLLYEHVPYAGH